MEIITLNDRLTLVSSLLLPTCSLIVLTTVWLLTRVVAVKFYLPWSSRSIFIPTTLPRHEKSVHHMSKPDGAACIIVTDSSGTQKEFQS